MLTLTGPELTRRTLWWQQSSLLTDYGKQQNGKMVKFMSS